MISNASQRQAFDGFEGTMISCRDVSKRFGNLEVLRNVDLEVRRGEVLCIVGPSGGGKSTLLRLLNGLETFHSGAIRVGNFHLPGNRSDAIKIRREVGMVFQSFNLFPHMTIRRNVALAPVRARGLSWDEATHRAEKLLSRVKISDQVDKYPHQLSGGQQQRAAIARALAMEPKVLLFDEPTSSLDPEMVKEVLDVMRELAHTGITMIVVTHEMGFAREVADHVAFMADGKLTEISPPSAFFSAPTDPRVTTFLAKIL